MLSSMGRGKITEGQKLREICAVNRSGSGRTYAFARAVLFGTGKISKRNSQPETECISVLKDPQAAANWAMRIYVEKNRAAIRTLHKNYAPDEPLAPPPITLALLCVVIMNAEISYIANAVEENNIVTILCIPTRVVRQYAQPQPLPHKSIEHVIRRGVDRFVLIVEKTIC